VTRCFTGRRRRRKPPIRWFLRGFVLTLLASMAALLGPASPASAHAHLLVTTPAAGYSVSASPAGLTLIFDQSVSLKGTVLHLSGGAGPVALGRAQLSNGDRWLSAAVPRPLPSGQYTVTWQVIASDGDVSGGSYSFAVGVTQASPGIAAGSTVTRGADLGRHAALAAVRSPVDRSRRVRACLTDLGWRGF
jgi:methionine-rich copper-binding protein CopC